MVPSLFSTLFLGWFCLLFLLPLRAVFDNVIKLTTFEIPWELFRIAVSGLILLLFTLETPSGLFLIIVSGLAGILLFGVLFDLLNLPGEHDHLFFIILKKVLHSLYPQATVLTPGIRWSSYGLIFKHALWCTHLLGSLKGVSLKFWEPALIPLVRIMSTKHKRGWIVFLKVVANFSQSVSAPVRVACSWLQTVSSSDLADWSWLGRM